MFVGPVFSREVAIAPRRLRIYIARTAYVAGLLLLVFTAWMVLCGSQNVRDVGDLARFGAILFQLLAPLQLAWAVFFSAMLAAAAVAQEKDRKTLLLLLLTRLTNSELVLGKLFASMLSVFVMLLAAIPLFVMLAMLGGISRGADRPRVCRHVRQRAGLRQFGIAHRACGGKKPFRRWRSRCSRSSSGLPWGRLIASGVSGETWWGISCKTLAVGISPWRAILEASQPWPQVDPALGWLQTPIYLVSARFRWESPC